MPARRLAQFQRDTQRARDLVGLGQSLGVMTSGLVDGSDVYRAALVQAVAALDAYVHGVVLDRGVGILLGRQPAGGKTKFGLPFHAVPAILSAATPGDAELAARTHLAQRLALETYQQPDAIGAALSMVAVPKVWGMAFPSVAEQAKQALSLVVQRRNRIVHQCDADPLSPGTVVQLTDADALDAISVVAGTVAAIDPHC